MGDDLRVTVYRAHLDIINAQDYLNRQLKKPQDESDVYDPRTYDKLLRGAIDLVATIIRAKVDAEVYARFNTIK